MHVVKFSCAFVLMEGDMECSQTWFWAIMIPFHLFSGGGNFLWMVQWNLALLVLSRCYCYIGYCYTGDRSEKANFLYLVAPLNSNQVKGNKISASGDSRNEAAFWQQTHEIFSLLPDPRACMTQRDRIVSRETRHMEKFQQKGTWSLALESQGYLGKVPIEKKKITSNSNEENHFVTHWKKNRRNRFISPCFFPHLLNWHQT